MRRLSGFTLLEVMLSITLIGLLAGIGIPLYLRLQTSNNLSVALFLYRDALRRAQTGAQAVEGDVSWGVRVATGTITLFRGANYGVRNQAFDEIADIDKGISVSGITEVVFSKVSGLPQSTGTTTFIQPGDSKAVSINAKGTLDY